MVNPFYQHQVLNNPKYINTEVIKPPNKAVANVCPSCGGSIAVYSIMAKGWVSKKCKWFLQGNVEL